MANEREFDLIVFGASGFTGCRVVEYLMKKINEGKLSVKLAAAGRDLQKVEKLLRERLSKHGIEANSVPQVKADVHDHQSIERMVARCKVLINCVGPFRFFGNGVVKACVHAGTHYVDISGEPHFIDEAHLKYDEEAKRNGVLIVPASGFDSVPADLGVVFATNQFEPPEACSSVESYFTIHGGKHGLTGNLGTFETFLESVSNLRELSRIRKQLARPPLTFIGPRLTRYGIHYDRRINKWAMPFFGSDPSVVRNSQYQLAANPSSASLCPVQYGCYVYFPSFFTMALTLVGLTIISFFAQFSFFKRLLKHNASFFTFGLFKDRGPTEIQIAESSFNMTFFSKGYSTTPVDNKTQPDIEVVTRVDGPEIGYVTTVICVAEAALTILEEKDHLPSGVISPATAFRSSKFLKRLQENGINFSIQSKKKL